MKKIRILLISTFITMSFSTISFAHSGKDFTSGYTSQGLANNISQSSPFLKVETTENVDRLLLKKEVSIKFIDSVDFKKLSFTKKSMLILEYFNLKTEIYKSEQKDIIASNDNIYLEKVKSSLISDSDNTYKDNELINQLVEDLRYLKSKSISEEELTKNKLVIENIVTSLKSFRKEGRNLDILISGKLKTVNANQVLLLDKFAQSTMLSGDNNRTLEIYKRVLNLTDGDLDTMNKISAILTFSNDNYFFIDHQLIVTNTPILQKSGISYINIDDLSSIENIGVMLTEEKSIITITNGINTIIINKEQNSLYLNNIKLETNNFTLTQDKINYIPMVSFFNMLNYNVVGKNDVNDKIFFKQVYGLNEIDELPMESIINSMSFN